MKFDKARNLVKLLLGMCMVSCIAGVIAKDSNVQMSATLGILSVVFFVLSFVVIGLFCKCANCGKHIYLGLFKAVNCPNCKRNLITGEKTKGKRR